MRAGQLRHWVALQRATQTQDAAGQPRTSWDTYANVYAAIEPAGGREFQLAGQTQAELTVPIRIRYALNVKPDDRVVWRERIFEVVSVSSLDERDRQIDLSCREVVPV